MVARLGFLHVINGFLLWIFSINFLIKCKGMWRVEMGWLFNRINWQLVYELKLSLTFVAQNYLD